MWNDFSYYFQQYLDHHTYLVPVGIIGLWRWSVWTIKEIFALFYKPQTKSFKTPVSVITPVYNENPKIFKRALESWKKNKPREIIAVIDYTDKACIKVFRQFKKNFAQAYLIITKVPGKRPALAKGIEKAVSSVVALVDSDTIWTATVIKNGLPPFHDRKVAGVATYQGVYRPKTIAQKLFDTQLDLRYCDDYPFLAVAGSALTCLSGRTAFYRRKVLLPMLPDLVHETFMGEPVISGDDKRLTYLVLAAGWKVAYQNNSKVYTPGMADLPSYIKQRLRWSRNALRADLKALLNGWPFRYPALVFFQIDKFLQGVVVAISPIYFIVSLLLHLWSAAAFILIWWTVSRLVKMYPHLKRRPRDIFLLPIFILNTFFTGILKIYAFFTLNTQGWITRWDVSRLQKLRFFQVATGYATTIIFLFAIGTIIFLVKEYTYILPQKYQQKLVATNLPLDNEKPISIKNPVADNPRLLTKKHIVNEGESLSGIAYQYGLSTDELLAVNVSRFTNWNRLTTGTILTIPGKDSHIVSSYKFNYQRIYDDPLVVTYDQKANTIYVSGRGKQVTLSDIQNRIGKELLSDSPGKIWTLNATIFIRSGVTLNLDKNEVTWLRLSSTRNKYVMLQAFNGIIEVNGVKITSWDPIQKDYDRNLNDGRSFILVKDGSRMDIYNAELAYLGFARAPNFPLSPYGVSWRMSRGKLGTTILTGEIINSKFHDNYFGAYTFGATGMLWKSNEFYNNVRYGLDPHDDSNGFLVENNRSHNNGTHGIIFSKRCMYNTIRNNLSYNNKLHGIMLHEKSSNNIIENNTLYGNTGGIVMWHSSNNLVRNNTVENNHNGIRGNAGSINNLIVKNTIKENTLYGIYFYNKADGNMVVKNQLLDNATAIYAKTNKNIIVKNVMEHNKTGIYFRDYAANNVMVANYIGHSTFYGIYSKLEQPAPNTRINNTLYRNRNDVVVSMNDKISNTGKPKSVAAEMKE